MKSNQLLLIIGIVMLINSSVLGQNSFTKGHFVTMADSRIEGLISRVGYTGTPQKFWYKKNSKSEGILLDVTNTKMVSIGDRIFENHTIEIEPQTSTAIGSQKPTVVAFAQKLIGNELGLYRYTDEQERDLFYIGESGKLTLLLNQSSINADVLFREVYKNTLNSRLSNCTSIQQHIAGINYTANSLYELFVKYYECIPFSGDLYAIKSDGSIVEEIKTSLIEYSKVEFNITPVVGLAKANIEFEGDPNRPPVSTVFSSSFTPTYGIFTNLKLNKDAFWSIGFSAMYTNLQTTGSTDRELPSNISVITNYDIEASHLKLELTPIVHIKSGTISVLLGAGSSIGFGKEKTNKSVHTTRQGNFSGIDNGVVYNSFQDLESGWLGLLGMKFKNHGLYFRYEVGNGITSEETMSSKTQRIYFTYGFTL